MAQGLLRNVGMDFEFGYMTLILAHVTFNMALRYFKRNAQAAANGQICLRGGAGPGCPPVKAFFKVVLPEIMPGILSGFLMAFTYSLDDFVISYFVSGATSQTLPITIYSMTRRKVSPEINAISAIIFVVVLVVLLLVNFHGAHKEKQSRREGVRI